MHGLITFCLIENITLTHGTGQTSLAQLVTLTT